MNRITTVVAGLSLAFVGTSTIIAATINVPSDYATIQDAINASSNGDVILIATGTYNEHSLNTGGKAITIRGALNSAGHPMSIVDANGAGRVFTINSGEGSETVIADLAVTGGYSSINGAGISIGNDCSPTISGCWIYGNTVTGNNRQGGGIGAGERVNSIISNCVISGNTASNRGGGIAMGRYCSPTIRDCTITGNFALGGGGLSFILSDVIVSGCTISDNISTYLGAGLTDDRSTISISECTISNNITTLDIGQAAGIHFYKSVLYISQSIICENATPGGPLQISDDYIAIESCIQDDCTVFCSAPTGACCIGGSCIATTESDCTAAGGTYTSDDVACADAGCPATCEGDANADGTVDVLDLLKVIDGWGSCP